MSSPNQLQNLKREQKAYRPQGTYLSALYDHDLFVALCGPAGTGKSRLWLEKIHLLCEKYDGARGLVTRKTRESLSESALATFELHVVPAGHPILSDTQRRFRQNYMYPRGSQISIVGLDNPQKIMSTEYDFIYLQEGTEADEEDIELLSTRLRNNVAPYQQFLIDFNPSYPHHWLNRAIKSGRIKCYNTIHEDNPTLFTEGPVKLWSPAAQKRFYSLAHVKQPITPTPQIHKSLVVNIPERFRTYQTPIEAPLDASSAQALDAAAQSSDAEEGRQVAQYTSLDPIEIAKRIREAHKNTMIGATPTEEFPHVAIDGRVGKWTPNGETYLATLNKLTGARLMRLRFGLWAGAEGMVYADAWDESINLIDPFPIPETWSHIWAIDFGFTNPFVWQDWALDGDGRMYLVQEIYMTQRLIEDHAKQIMQVTGWMHTDEGNVRCEPLGKASPMPIAIVCDHDAEGRATLEREFGWHTTPAYKSVGDGVEAVARRMRVQRDGKARLYIFKRSLVEVDYTLDSRHLPTCTPQEVDGYIWDPKVSKDKSDTKKEVPLKTNDHGCDTMRYAACEADGLRATYKAGDVAMVGDVKGTVVSIPVAVKGAVRRSGYDWTGVGT